MSEPVHHSLAWLLSGIANTPGFLGLSKGTLLFVSDHGVVFDVPLAKITDLRFPWYYFSGGFTATLGGVHRRVSLTRPNGAPRPSTSLAEAFGGELASATISLHDVGAGRTAGKAWRALLAGSTSASRAG